MAEQEWEEEEVCVVASAATAAAATATSSSSTLTHPKVGLSLLDSAPPGSHLHVSLQTLLPNSRILENSRPLDIGGGGAHLVLRIRHRVIRVLPPPPPPPPPKLQQPSKYPCRSRAVFPGSSPHPSALKHQATTHPHTYTDLHPPRPPQILINMGSCSPFPRERGTWPKAHGPMSQCP